MKRCATWLVCPLTGLAPSAKTLCEIVLYSLSLTCLAVLAPSQCARLYNTVHHSILPRTLSAGQGGTCIVLGDDHAWVAEASKLAQERIKCVIQPASPFYRREGHMQARMHVT